MAFQVGEIKLSGTFDDLSFYHSVFGWLVRTKGGPTRKQFKTSPRFARSRENSNEFTICSRAASLLRGIIAANTEIKDKTLYHRLMKLMRLLADLDHNSLRGQRDPFKGINNSDSWPLLKSFQISTDLTLYDIFFGQSIFKPAEEDQQRVSGNKRPVITSKRQRKTKPLTFTYRSQPTKESLLTAWRTIRAKNVIPP